MAKYVKIFFSDYLALETKLYFLGIIFLALNGFIYILINHFYTHFTGAFYIPDIWLFIAPIVFAVLITAICTERHSPRLGYFTKTYTTYFFIFLSLSVMTTGIQYTPFRLIDHYLVTLDQDLGFYTLPVLNWTYAHHTIKTLFLYCYSSLGFQLIFLPLIVALLLEKRSIQLYFFGLLISYFIGMNLYYFFPTAGPTVAFNSPHFLKVQHDTFIKFFEVHHRLLLTTTEGGMIAFPSFHVIWAFFMIVVSARPRWLFYPILILNIFVILSTIFLGWHYLVDLIAGLLLGYFSIYLAGKIINYYSSSL